MKRAPGSPLPCFLPAGCMLTSPFFGFCSRFLLLRPWFIIPFTFPLDNHLSLCKHQSRTRELMKVRPVTHRRMFFSFSFMRLSSQENLFVMKLACLLFLRGSSFQLWLSKSTLNFSLVLQLTYHSPGPSEYPGNHFLFLYAAFLAVVVFILHLDYFPQISILLRVPYT